MGEMTDDERPSIGRDLLVAGLTAVITCSVQLVAGWWDERRQEKKKRTKRKRKAQRPNRGGE